jgi:hypothetical protein
MGLQESTPTVGGKRLHGLVAVEHFVLDFYGLSPFYPPPL